MTCGGWTLCRYADIIVHRLLLAALHKSDWWAGGELSTDLFTNTLLQVSGFPAQSPKDKFAPLEIFMNLHELDYIWPRQRYIKEQTVVANVLAILSKLGSFYGIYVFVDKRLNLLKGTVARDFRPLVFSMNRTHIVPKFTP